MANPSHHKKTQLYVIDDHFLIIEGLYSSFDLEDDDFKVTGGSLNVTDGLKEISGKTVDIIILDLFIGNSDPVSNLNRIRTTFPSIPVVILSHEDSPEWQVEMIRNGVSAYIHKGDEKTVMRQHLSLVAAGETVMPKDIAQLLVSSKANSGGNKLPSDFKQIISLLSNGYTTIEIGAKLNQTDSCIEKRLQSIRACFNARTNSELVYKATTKKFGLI
jgi:DNA-binding NarL/FixJ family response regulator